MEWGVIAWTAPNPAQRSGEGHQKGLCRNIEATGALKEPDVLCDFCLFFRFCYFFLLF